jgi:hypothetical protein
MSQMTAWKYGKALSQCGRVVSLIIFYVLLGPDEARLLSFFFAICSFFFSLVLRLKYTWILGRKYTIQLKNPSAQKEYTHPKLVMTFYEFSTLKCCRQMGQPRCINSNEELEILIKDLATKFDQCCFLIA